MRDRHHVVAVEHCHPGGAAGDARDKGYGETHQDMKLGDCGLSVALKRYDGHAVGALQITGTLDDHPLKHLGLLQAAAADLRRQLI